MSIVTRSRITRFLVSYDGQRHFVNANSETAALALVRTKLIVVAQRAGLVPDSDLANTESFAAVATVRENVRY